MNIKKIHNTVLDNLYGALMFPNAITRPRAWLGRPYTTKSGREEELQSLLFDELRESGFKRTPFQIVFPKQTVGIVYPITDDERGITEAHVRFYRTREVHCEMEMGRFDPNHYTGPRYDGKEFLEEILSEGDLDSTIQSDILGLVANKDYSMLCARVKENNLYQNLKYRGVGTAAFMLYRHGIGTIAVLGSIVAYITPSEANPTIFAVATAVALVHGAMEFIGLNVAGHAIDLRDEVNKINQSID